MIARGLSATEMEDIRLACGISRGGLYHHFANKRAVLEGLVAEEVTQLAGVLAAAETSPILALLRSGSGHLGRDVGVLAALSTRDDKLDYLAALDDAYATILMAPLSAQLKDHVRAGVHPGHVVELFLTINAHINRREILGQWSRQDAAGFAATALAALAPLLAAPQGLDPIITELTQAAQTR